MMYRLGLPQKSILRSIFNAIFNLVKINFGSKFCVKVSLNVAILKSWRFQENRGRTAIVLYSRCQRVIRYTSVPLATCWAVFRFSTQHRNVFGVPIKEKCCRLENKVGDLTASTSEPRGLTVTVPNIFHLPICSPAPTPPTRPICPSPPWCPPLPWRPHPLKAKTPPASMATAQ